MEKAVLLTESGESSDTGRLDRTLAFFGVTACHMTVAEFLSASCVSEGNPRFRLLCKGSTFLELLGALDGKEEGHSFWEKYVHSAFVYAGNDFAALERAAAIITGFQSPLSDTNPAAEWVVSDNVPEFCKSMSGIRVRLTENASEKGFSLDVAKGSTVCLISSGRHTAYVRFLHHTIPIFISTVTSLIDIKARLTGTDFDIRQHFMSATPLVLYTKWAFQKTCWQAPETPACLVIDDPLLKPRYGFLRFRRLLDLMRQHNFSTSIAFIPWNWRRSNSRVVRLFKDNPDRLSVSVHGCDHTGGEFGSLNRGLLAWKSGESLRRMERHQAQTGLPYDPVMVFPQGVFSAQAMQVLKHSQFMGTVNSEVFSTDPDPPQVTIDNYWQGAVMNYSDFPIFTRRYPSAGVENFAFDILLGKPCLVVVHHNDCYDDCRHVGEFMQRLNQLNVAFHWTSLAEVVRRTFRQREASPEVVEIEMYGSEVRIENLSGLKKRFRFRKRESEAGHIKAIQATGQSIRWDFPEGEQAITFEVDLNPDESKIVKVTYHEFATSNAFAGEGLSYKLKVRVRRYLCEARDNYLRRKTLST